MIKPLLVVLVSALLLGCGAKTVVSSPLPCPDPLVLEKAKPEIRQQIDDMRDSADPVIRETYEFFLRRAAIQKARRLRLQEICRSTHGD